MRRSFRSLLICIALLSVSARAAGAAADLPAKQAEVNGVRLDYVEQGSGTPVVLVHGAILDLRSWGPVREPLARKHRFIAYTQRYHGTAPWPDEGKAFGTATHADDLAGFIASLNSGPVHLVGWSYGAAVAAVAAANNPHLIKSLVLYEPGLSTVLAPGSPGAKQAAEEAARVFGPAAGAAKAGDNEQAAFRLMEGAFQMRPGEAARQPEPWPTIWRDNARTVPLFFSAPRPNATCDTMRSIARPTLVLVGAETRAFFPVIAERLLECIPGAERAVLPGVNHDGPVRDPAGFSAAVEAFISRR